MLRKITFIFISICLLSCSDESSDCFKKEGDLVTKTIEVEPFWEIHSNLGIELTIEQATEQSVEVTAGKNKLEKINFEVHEGVLKITDNNGCELLRSINSAKVLVKSPNIKKIYSASQYPTRSNGVLNYSKLTLETGIFQESTPSIFEFEVENDTLILQDNVSTQFHIKGKTNFLESNFWSGSGRLEAENLEAQEIKIFQRSSNDMIVFPIQKISGKILGTGNLLLKNVPSTIEIEQFYTGHIVYP